MGIEDRLFGSKNGLGFQWYFSFAIKIAGLVRFSNAKSVTETIQ